MPLKDCLAKRLEPLLRRLEDKLEQGGNLRKAQQLRQKQQDWRTYQPQLWEHFESYWVVERVQRCLIQHEDYLQTKHNTLFLQLSETPSVADMLVTEMESIQQDLQDFNRAIWLAEREMQTTLRAFPDGPLKPHTHIYVPLLLALGLPSSVHPGWHLAYPGFGILALIALGVFDTCVRDVSAKGQTDVYLQSPLQTNIKQWKFFLPQPPQHKAPPGREPWQIGCSAFGLFGLIVLGAFGTLFAICFMRAKQRYAIGEYTPDNYEDWNRAYHLTRPPPRRKWWRVLLENFCCCFITPTKTNIQGLLMEEGRVPPDTVHPAPPAPPGPPAAPPVPPRSPLRPAPPGPPVAPAGQTTGGTGAPGGKKGVKAWILGKLRKPKSP
ncbi:hypothetical protein BDV24DRAFT_162300 [Aspergillus arachidicola]|uniref:Uncharacterized protein n=1 Tax=Aspergillus arachidicola TaxID=656916 RepID=A0A5N6YGP2_9EURO|nr:hypothetical protein BDV24DRAFT_162300 [Aspergillus arachidicola]